MTIAAILESKGDEVIDVAGEASVGEAVALLAGRRIGALPVTEGGRVVGMFSERDVIYGLARDGGALLARSVREVMTAPAHTVTPDVPVLAALGLMTQRRVRHLPVVDGERLVGLVSIGDLVKMRIDRIEAEADAMRDYIQTA
ncbi:MAG: CBS domain-containing protein [Sphingomonadaceae bacterium]|nr:CBS domain-containing protein [Sphingomonadaceae bacterium]